MQNPPDISIIIPAYGVEEWIERAVRSLQDQTFPNYEIVIIDDGSPDETGAIADRLAAEDARITVIHQANAGAASARNTGMAQATGEYLFFMDADDWCEPTMLADMLRLAFKHDLDLVVTGFYIDTYYGTGAEETRQFYREQRNAPDAVYTSAAEFRAHAAEYFYAQLLYAPWNKLYRRAYVQANAIQFPQTFWDDLPFNVEVLRDIERVGLLDGHYYHFLRAREESENTKYRPDMYEKREEEDALLQGLFSYWGVTDSTARELLALRYAERLIGCVENLTCKDCTLSDEERKVEVARMLSTPRAQEALELAKPQSLMMRLLFAPMRAGNVDMTLGESSVISFVKEHSTALFARLKANRQRW